MLIIPTADGVLDWFRRQVREDGLAGSGPERYWFYVDWVSGWENGIPPAYGQGPLTVTSLMYAAALLQAAELQEAVGRPDAAREYRSRAAALNEAVKRLCWSEEEQLYKDGPNVEDYSQHTQIWSVVQGPEATALTSHLGSKGYRQDLLFHVVLSFQGVGEGGQL